ncbi:NAD(P)-dependent oxidoreductase [Paucilactobacillus suebicus]|uniref:D-3-phosphoglycerate dehydrogenase n=1 Tax=Paucilactobacillus suebicus DSM 5007 = KCTC 3549 TaxID=1423807 RepID=A0A0R1W3C2_9LACO|nr:NAD(P)-dependent oxidoreductase [Paucilactobacillus suebicus]KRM12154.1 D-3-phosphoglycerate dehydrogenase [Paucilactobacillus suebicus DSM 5007 = KCTC 3549]
MSSKNLLVISQITDDQKNVIKKMGINVFGIDDLDVQVSKNEINILYGWNKKIGLDIINADHSSLEWIHAISAGVDSIPMDILSKRNIKLTNASGIHAESISQSVIAFILHFVRGIDNAESNRLNKNWITNENTQPAIISDFDYLIFGTGHIGQQIARLLKSLGGHTTGVNTSGHPAEYFDKTVSIKNVSNQLIHADVIINVMPLTDSTLHYFNYDRFASAKEIFLFINVGRGPVVESKGLIKAINDGTIKHAALDVFEEEPLKSDSPFWTLPNTIITPHNTGVVRHFKNKQMRIFLPNLEQYLKDGTFKSNQVNLNSGY